MMRSIQRFKGDLQKLERGMRILITGSRYYPAIEIRTVLDRYKGAVEEIIVGDATGADEAARAWAKDNNVKLTVGVADWNKYGKGAGPRRNQWMVDHDPDLCIAFPVKGSRGTWDCVKRAQAKNIPVTIIRQDNDEIIEDRPVINDSYVEAVHNDVELMRRAVKHTIEDYHDSIVKLADI